MLHLDMTQYQDSELSWDLGTLQVLHSAYRFFIPESYMSQDKGWGGSLVSHEFEGPCKIMNLLGLGLKSIDFHPKNEWFIVGSLL